MKDKTLSELRQEKEDLWKRYQEVCDDFLASGGEELHWTSGFDKYTSTVLECLAFLMDTKLCNYGSLVDFLGEARDQLEYYQDMYHAHKPLELKSGEDEDE